MRWLPDQLPFNYRTLLAFTVPLLLWVIVSAICAYALNRAQASYLQLADARETLLIANEFRRVINDIRTEQRAYLLTSDPRYIETHDAGLTRANELFATLRNRLNNQPQQLERLHVAGNMLQEWFYDHSRKRIEARARAPLSRVNHAQELQLHLAALLARAPGPEDHIAKLRAALGALQVDAVGTRWSENMQQAMSHLDRYESALRNNDTTAVVADTELVGIARSAFPVTASIFTADDRLGLLVEQRQGNALVTGFSATMDSIIATETSLAENYRAEAIVGADIIRWTIWAGLAISVLLMVLVVAWFMRRIGSSVEDLDLAAAELSRGNLTARIPGGKEAGSLACRFNRMAELLEKRQSETRHLARLAEMLHNSRSVAEALDVFGGYASVLFPEHAGVLFLIEQSSGDVTAVTSWRAGEAISDTQMTTHDCWALRLGRMHENGKGSIRCDHLRDNVNSLCVPLPAFGEIIGLIFVTLDTKEDPTGVEHERERQFVATVAEQVALALANVKLREELNVQAIRDPLTHLYNRRHLDEVIDREFHRAQRHGVPLAVIAFDIDDFKAYKKNSGRDSSDQVLVRLGGALRDFFRPEDGIFRAGDERFIALLPGISRDDALARAEELRVAVSSMDMLKGNARLPGITISVGVACFPEDAVEVERLLRQVELALGKARQEGGNRVASAGG